MQVVFIRHLSNKLLFFLATCCCEITEIIAVMQRQERALCSGEVRTGFAKEEESDLSSRVDGMSRYLEEAHINPRHECIGWSQDEC